jgi:capsid protein
MLSFRNTIEGYRWLTLVPMFCAPVRRKFIDMLVLQGKIPASAVSSSKINLYATQWTAPKFESVDPVKDTQADLKRIRMGVLTLSEAIAQNGYDPDAQLQEIARINAKLDELEIVLDCDPRNTTDRGQEQASDTEERTPGSKAAPATSRASRMSVKEIRKRVEELSNKADYVTACAYQHGKRSWSATSRLYLS